MFDVTPAVVSDRTGSTDHWSDVPASRLTAVPTRADVAASVGVRRPTDWSDLPSGVGRLSEVRRRLRVLQVQRAGQGRGLAA